MNKRTLKLLAVVIFLLALAMLVYSLPQTRLTNEVAPVSADLLVSPAELP